MKKFMVLMALLASQSVLSAPLALNEYSASVEGSIELLTNNGDQATLNSGVATIEVGRVNIFTSPIEYSMGGRNLTVKQGNNEFKFLIPFQYSKKSGSILIHRKEAKQLAHLAFEESKEFVKSYEETGIRSCDYEEMSLECTADAQGQTSCGNRIVTRSGRQKARYLVNEYNRNIKLMIAYASKKVLLQTEPQAGAEYEILEKLTSCR